MTPITLNATRHYGAKGGDLVQIQANNLEDYDSLRCRFSANVTVGGVVVQRRELFTNASLSDYRTLRCRTPAWGKHFVEATADVTVEYLAGSSWVPHPRVASEGYTFFFYEVSKRTRKHAY